MIGIKLIRKLAMRAITRQSTARCDTKQYISYLLSDPLSTSCTRLSKVMGDVSHDSVNRFLLREEFSPSDLYHEVAPHFNNKGGILSIDDSVLDKPYSDPKKSHLVDYYWSGKHHSVVKGCNIITLFYTDPENARLPVNYRIYDKADGKSKNDYFLEMLDEVLSWGLLPAWVTGDCWYSSLKNLKHVRKNGLNFLFGVEGNRLISVEKGSYVQSQALEEYPADGATVYLKEYGKVKLFKQTRKNVSRYYIISAAQLDDLDDMNSGDFEKVHAAHWNIEIFHRAIKQVCHIEHFQVRQTQAVSNHIHCSLLAFVQLEIMTLKQEIKNWYQLKKNLFLNVIRQFISEGACIRCPVHLHA